MIHVRDLTKSYGPARALKGISFDVGKGDVVGFLGPNGAGKSTTMKILTGYLLPTSGQASVDGLDVVSESLAVRQRIGYLPESTPLYSEMRVDEYLRFVAEIRGVAGRKSKRAVARVVDLCGLEKVVGKNIIELSKGYRQRVGLAQAMVHEPDLLILDEPTSGLDPNQIIEVRSLIERLSEDHTVILSTHYLQEVEAVASRVIIVHLGEIVADDTRAGLVERNGPGPIVARIKGDPPAVLRQLAELLPDRRVDQRETVDGFTRYRIEVGSITGGTIEDAITQLVVKNGWVLVELTREHASLEDAFRQLTVGAAGSGSGESAPSDDAEVAHA